MKLQQKIITGGLIVAGLAGLFGCDYHQNIPKANYDNKEAIFKIPTGGYGTRAFAIADVDGDGIPDLLSTGGGDRISDLFSTDNGKVYFHKGLGNLKFEERAYGPIFKIATGGYGTRAIAADDVDGDGIVDLLSTDGGKVYFHKGLGDLKFQE